MTSMDDIGYVESPGFFSPAQREDAEPPGVRRFYGKYRGSVVQNVDPLGMGRLLVSVPDVFGVFPTSWAMPCVPLAGLQTGMFVVPSQQAGVWVEFEGGDPDHPIWTGFFWGSRAETPSTVNTLTPGSPAFLVESAGKSKVAVSDTPVAPMKGGGVLVQSPSASITVDSAGVTITAQNINLIGLVNINNGALVVKTA
ncbi:phage baseplate assembly protein V [Streptomyces sp. NBC_00827]|uniref:phage baseplate assembly protein V n=1 Tax=Streptomyces sp. NBC_00827 TaxID=2903677 RepID=UPI00386E0DF0|nr:phage baseplate assembly protein V [Streptomyces sp. NBC_00827]